MLFNLLNKFVLWLKKVFYIRRETTEEKTGEFPRQVPPKLGIYTEPPSKASEEKIPRLDLEEDKTNTQKPYKKKIPTEERKKEREKPSESDKKVGGLKQMEEIDLGNIKRKKIRSTKQPEAGIKKPVTLPKRKEIPTRVASPYVEINLDEARVFLFLPEQRFEPNKDDIPQQLTYNLELNDKEQQISVKVSKDKQGITKAEERKIELEEPLDNLKIVFPDELQGRTYIYKHSNSILYAFIPTGNNRGRIRYIYDKDGNINNLPKIKMWILLHKDFELVNQDVITEEGRWMWEIYRPFFINLEKTDELVVRNRETSKEEKISCEATFSIEGKELVEDDFKDQSPIFVGNTVKIKAHMKNPSGWMVWLQNKLAAYRIISENWTGTEVLELKLPDDLPCDCGEFQVDICEQDDRISIETLFFRYIPHLQLKFPTDLIIPESNIGHKQEIVEILFEKDFQVWELKADGKIQHKHIENGYQVELVPVQDILRFSLMKKGKPETEASIKITIPRLKWRTSKQKTWNDKPQKIKREELIWGEEFYLFICPNDFNIIYDLLAILETNSHDLMEAKFTRKGLQYIVSLNEFYDTIKENKDALTLKVYIRKANDNRLLGKPEILHFEGFVQEPFPPKSISYDLINIISLPKICFILRRIKAICPKEKLVCKDILQIYYQKIRCAKRTKRDVGMHKKDFVVRALAFIKVIIDSNDKKALIKGQKEWEKRIDFLQQEYPEEFNNANDIFSRR